jgi:hypothetical protein
MAIFIQRKIIIILLVLYWLVLVVFAHIPVPGVIEGANVSDKGLHFMAYLVLTFLLWFSIRPNEKVRWHKFSAWLLLFLITGYGAADEVVQSFIGRTFDMLDIAANFSGAFFGLLLLTFLTFLPAALIIAGIVIFGMANIARTNLAEIFPFAYGVFYFFSYAIFTLFWLLNMNFLFPKKPAKLQWLILGFGLPMCFLLIVKTSTIMLGRDIATEDIFISVAAITIITVGGYLRVFPKQSAAHS